MSYVWAGEIALEEESLLGKLGIGALLWYPNNELSEKVKACLGWRPCLTKKKAGG